MEALLAFVREGLGAAAHGASPGSGAALADVAPDRVALPTVVPEVAVAAEAIGRRLDGVATLFYGSVLRTGDLDGLLDFYVLVDEARHKGLRGMVANLLWPDISFEEVMVGDRLLRAKVATMTLEQFRLAAEGGLLDTTIWSRFVQPSALAWAADGHTADAVVRAVAEAAISAGRFAAVLGPEEGDAHDFWRALFRETYRVELRVERLGREEEILARHPAYYARLLLLAWRAGAMPHVERDGIVRPLLAPRVRRKMLAAWRPRRRTGRLLNVARLVKAALMLDGAAGYAVWKINRHTGADILLSPRMASHPLLSALWVLWKARRAISRSR